MRRPSETRSYSAASSPADSWYLAADESHTGSPRRGSHFQDRSRQRFGHTQGASHRNRLGAEPLPFESVDGRRICIVVASRRATRPRRGSVELAPLSPCEPAGGDPALLSPDAADSGIQCRGRIGAMRTMKRDGGSFSAEPFRPEAPKPAPKGENRGTWSGAAAHGNGEGKRKQ